MTGRDLPERGEIVPPIEALPLVGSARMLEPEAASAAFFEAQERDPELARLVGRAITAAANTFTEMLENESRHPAATAEAKAARMQDFISVVAERVVGQVLFALGSSTLEVQALEADLLSFINDEPHGGGEAQPPAV